LPPIGVVVVAGAMGSLGATKFVVLVGAGLAGSVLIKNNKVFEFFGDLSKVRQFYIYAVSIVLGCVSTKLCF